MFSGSSGEVVIYYLAGTAFVFLLVTIIVIIIFLHQKRADEYRYRLKQEEMERQRSVFAAEQEGEERERSRIAEELHDGVGAQLCGLKMKLDYLRSEISDVRNLKIIEDTCVGINDSINELREISHDLQPAQLVEKSLQQAVADYIDGISTGAGCQFHVYYEPGDVIINFQLKRHCYRIITELLHNICKHSSASSASVQISSEENKIQLIIEDNGKGFDSQQATDGIGLRNIHNRVKLCGGAIHIDLSDKGTTVIIELPLNN